MSFSYYALPTGITAHKHSSAAGDGGSLDTTTQLNNASLYVQMVALS